MEQAPSAPMSVRRLRAPPAPCTRLARPSAEPCLAVLAGIALGARRGALGGLSRLLTQSNALTPQKRPRGV